MNYTAVVLCAGSGTRAKLGYNKVLYEYGGKPLFLYAVESFLNDVKCAQVIVVTKREERSLFESEVMSHKQRNKLIFIDGGKERSDSVSNAIEAVESPYVLIHDAARLAVEHADAEALCNALTESDAALLGLPVVDTVKRVENGFVVGTENRECLYLAQTPQAFHTEMIQRLIKQAQVEQYSITDEIMLIEKYCKSAKIKILPGSKRNNKWTVSGDFGGEDV